MKDKSQVIHMNTYEAVKLRILKLCEEKHMTINKLATESAVLLPR